MAARSEPVVRKATRDDVDSLVPVLARAFADDPFTVWFLRRDGAERAAERWFRMNLERLALPYDQVYTTADRSGAALWVPPGRWKMGLWEQLKYGPTFAAIVKWTRLFEVMRGTKEILDFHPHEPHHYLAVLGVDPPAQGRGVGPALIAPMLARCDREAIGAYLETSKPENVRFYQRFGFRVTREVRIPDGPLVWLMWRDPRPAA